MHATDADLSRETAHLVTRLYYALQALVAGAMGKAVVEDQGTNEQEVDADPEADDVDDLEEVA